LDSWKFRTVTKTERIAIVLLRVCTVAAGAVVFGFTFSVIPAIIINGFHFTFVHKITGIVVSFFLFVSVLFL